MENNRNMFESWTAFWILICIIAVLFILSFFISSRDTDESSSTISNYNENYSQYNDNIDESINSNRNDEDWIPHEGDEGYYNRETLEDVSRSYKYQLIAEDGVVNVYSIDSDGQKSFFCETQIQYSILSESDKIMLRKGMVLDTMEDLNSILQDFDS